MGPQRHQQGFTLIEALVALSIIAVSLSALGGRLGLSADTQRSLIVHSTMLEVATNLLEEQRLAPSISKDEKQGEVEVRGMHLNWRMYIEKTMLDNFVRQNVVVSHPGEPDVSLFLFHVI